MNSATPHITSPPDPSPTLVISFGGSLIVLCLPYAVVLQTAPSIQGEAVPGRAAQDNPFPPAASSAVPDAPQGTAGPLGCYGTLMARIQLPVDQNLQIPFCRAALLTLICQPVPAPSITPPQVLNT